MQVRGCGKTRLISPDPASGGSGQVVQAGRVAWATVKAAILVIVAYGVLRAGWSEVLRLSELEGQELARASSRLVLGLGGVLAGVLLVLGFVDYGLRPFRFEAMLRTTAQEQREDQRAMEGDPVSRAQRRRIARSWRGDSPDLLAAFLQKASDAGLYLEVRLPSPNPVRHARELDRPVSAARRSAAAIKVPQIEAGDLARPLDITRFGFRPSPPRTGSRLRRGLAATITSANGSLDTQDSGRLGPSF